MRQQLFASFWTLWGIRLFGKAEKIGGCVAKLPPFFNTQRVHVNFPLVASTLRVLARLPACRAHRVSGLFFETTRMSKIFATAPQKMGSPLESRLQAALRTA